MPARPKRLLEPFAWSERHRQRLDDDGHLVLPGILTEAMRERLSAALRRVADRIAHDRAHDGPGHVRYGRYAAEHDAFLASLIAHPQMLSLARSVLGSEVRYDHCVAITRAPGDPGMNWHVHPYAEASPDIGFLRIFFYVNGFSVGDGGLRVVPGSHLFRDGRVRASDDAELSEGWLRDKVHPRSGAPLTIAELDAPPGSVVLLWTHALHGVSPRRATSPRRWMVVYGYRNPGAHSESRWIGPDFERAFGAELGPLLAAD